jgi:hypothetical protein
MDIMPRSADPRDAAMVRQVAQAFLDRCGANATAELENLAEIAAGIGDVASTDAWLEIADAAAELLMKPTAPRQPATNVFPRRPFSPVEVERWLAAEAGRLALKMPDHLAEQLARIAEGMENHAAMLAARIKQPLVGFG